jgi:cell division septation protein DedD
MSTRALVTLFAIPLLVLVSCSRENSDWRSAQAADTPESYEQFVAAHPDSTHVASARERLAQLAEEKDWRTAAEADTLDAYQRFLAQYPAGKWAKEARERADNFANAGSAANTGPAAIVPPPSVGDAAPPPGVMIEGIESGTAEPEAPATPDSAGGFGVQLGAFSTAERANEEWKKLQADAKGLLDGLAPRVVVGDSGGKTIYRLQAEVRDEAQARAICGGLKVAKKSCVPVLPATR